MKVKKPHLRHFGADVYVFIALFVVSFALLVLSTRSFTVFRDVGLSTFSGVRGGIHSVQSFFAGTATAVREVLVLRREYEELTERMTRYEQEMRTSAEIREENYRLREQLDFSRGIQYRHIAAEISGRDPDNLFQAFVINKGTKHGVARDMSVVAYRAGVQALAGKVIEAGFLESLVMPLYDTTSYVSARFAASRYEGIVEGQGESELPLLIRYVSKRAQDEIKTGDLVITSGLGGIYPAGITIGRVSKVEAREAETSMDLELESALDFSKLEYVFVLDTKTQSVTEAAQ